MPGATSDQTPFQSITIPVPLTTPLTGPTHVLVTMLSKPHSTTTLSTAVRIFADLVAFPGAHGWCEAWSFFHAGMHHTCVRIMLCFNALTSRLWLLSTITYWLQAGRVRRIQVLFTNFNLQFIADCATVPTQFLHISNMSTCSCTVCSQKCPEK